MAALPALKAFVHIYHEARLSYGCPDSGDRRLTGRLALREFIEGRQFHCVESSLNRLRRHAGECLRGTRARSSIDVCVKANGRVHGPTQ
jgi:hypothetical protein